MIYVYNVLDMSVSTGRSLNWRYGAFGILSTPALPCNHSSTLGCSAVHQVLYGLLVFLIALLRTYRWISGNVWIGKLGFRVGLFCGGVIDRVSENLACFFADVDAFFATCSCFKVGASVKP